MKLSLLIPSLESRKDLLSHLVCGLISQCGSIKAVESYLQNSCCIFKLIFKDCEIIVATDNKLLTTGHKRNMLVSLANGVYCTFVDDDDIVPEYYIEEILKAAESNVDCFATNGIMTTDGNNETKWYISKDLPYTDSVDERGNKVYLRYPNHISIIKSAIVKQVPFPDKSFGEDYEFATELHKRQLIKTEYKIDKPMYHYKYNSKK